MELFSYTYDNYDIGYTALHFTRMGRHNQDPRNRLALIQLNGFNLI